MTRIFYGIALVGLALGGCRAAAPPDAAPTSLERGGLHVILVRHAETEPDGTRDPALSQKGRRRAERLAQQIEPAGLIAVYATEYRRTQQTATPAAEENGLAVEVVPYGAGPLDAYAARMASGLRQHLDHLPASDDTILVVGHSNTVPALAEALTGQAVDPIGEDEYDRIIHVLLRARGGTIIRDTVLTATDRSP